MATVVKSEAKSKWSTTAGKKIHNHQQQQQHALSSSYHDRTPFGDVNWLRHTQEEEENHLFCCGFHFTHQLMSQYYPHLICSSLPESNSVMVCINFLNLDWFYLMLHLKNQKRKGQRWLLFTRFILNFFFNNILSSTKKR